MLLMEAKHIKHYVRDRLLLDIAQISVHQNERIGLVGKNGSGKTTLLNLISGSLLADEGNISGPSHIELLPQLKRTDTTKSGGEVTQEYIQKALNSNAALLLVDEPTTNLDTTHIEWLESKLKEWQGALIIVSHDRTFLDALCSTIWEIKEGRITEYKGNYSNYAKQKEVEYQQEKLAFEKYQNEKRQLEEAIRAKKEQAQRATKRPKNVSNSEARITGVKTHFANKQKKLRKTVTVMETRLENLEVVKRSNKLPPIQMDLPNEESFRNRTVLRVQNISGVVGDRLLWKKTNFQVQGGDKLAIIGANGSGKTTLVKKIINQELGITLSPSVKIGYFAQNLSILDNEKTILENVKESSNQNETLIRTVLARMHFFDDDVYKSVKVLSGGERVKVALSKVFLSNVNMLVLDEPTNFLDLESLESLEALLQEYDGSIIFISHDRQFVENIATRILEIHNNELILFDGTYKEFRDRQPEGERDLQQDQALLLDTKISEVLSRLSIEPSEELEMEFQRLIKEKQSFKK